MTNSLSFGSLSKHDSSDRSCRNKCQNETTISLNVKQPYTCFEWSTADISRQPDIKVHSTQDSNKLWITGITFLSPNLLLIADFNNSCIKQIDSNTGTITGYLSMSSAPWDIATLGSGQAAVSLPNESQLRIISTISMLNWPLLYRILRVILGQLHILERAFETKMFLHV